MVAMPLSVNSTLDGRFKPLPRGDRRRQSQPATPLRPYAGRGNRTQRLSAVRAVGRPCACRVHDGLQLTGAPGSRPRLVCCRVRSRGCKRKPMGHPLNGPFNGPLQAAPSQPPAMPGQSGAAVEPLDGRIAVRYVTSAWSISILSGGAFVCETFSSRSSGSC